MKKLSFKIKYLPEGTTSLQGQSSSPNLFTFKVLVPHPVYLAVSGKLGKANLKD